MRNLKYSLESAKAVWLGRWVDLSLEWRREAAIDG